MTPRRAGWLSGSGVAASRRGRLAALVAAAATYLAVGVAMWWQSRRSPRAPDEDPVEYALELVGVYIITGTGFALAAAVVAWWVVRHALGRDGAERVLALETTGLRGRRQDWGVAMRAELASIDEPSQRAWFARSAGLVAVRRGTGRWPAVLAMAAGATTAALVYAAARVSFDRPRDHGIVGEPLMGFVLLVLVMTVVAGTLIGRSFRAGLETAVLAWVSVYVATLAVEVPQALAWYHDAGLLLLDGEGAASHGVDALGAALQPVTHPAFVFVSVAQLAVALLSAAAGVVVIRLVRRPRSVAST